MNDSVRPFVCLYILLAMYPLMYLHEIVIANDTSYVLAKGQGHRSKANATEVNPI